MSSNQAAPAIPQTSHYDATGRFLIGIPVWIGMTLLLDGLGGAMEGMTGAAPGRLITTWPSHFVLGYFVISILATRLASGRTWRLRLGCLAHLCLLTSICIAVAPELGNKSPADLAEGITVLVFAYALFFFPWLITWIKFILRADVAIAIQPEHKR